MEKLQKKKGKTNKGDDDEVTSRRTNSSAKVFKNLQKIVTEDYKRKNDKKESKLSGKTPIGKRSYTESGLDASGGGTRKYML